MIDPECPIAEDALAEFLQETAGDGELLADYFVRAGLDQIQAIQTEFERPWTKEISLELVDDARRRIEREAQRAPLAVLRQCQQGCTACCHNTGVDVTPLEAIELASHLLRRYSGDKLHDLRERLSKVLLHRQRLSDDQRGEVRLRCALLDDNRRCMGYEVRPLVCAGAFSYSRSACEVALRRPDALGDHVPLDGPSRVWTMGISAGLQRAVSEAGLDGNLYELHSVLLQALTRSEAAMGWLRGEDVFAECECTDPHSAPRRDMNESA